jgi:transposase InsO family protein
MLTILDEYSRECLPIDVGRRLTHDAVLHRLTDLFFRRGIPEHIRSDNGAEFTAKAVRTWLSRPPPPGKRPLGHSLQPSPIAPPIPSWLPAEAKKRWKELAPELEKLGLFTSIDGPVFALMLTHYAFAEEAIKEIKKVSQQKSDGKN